MSVLLYFSGFSDVLTIRNHDQQISQLQQVSNDILFEVLNR